MAQDPPRTVPYSARVLTSPLTGTEHIDSFPYPQGRGFLTRASSVSAVLRKDLYRSTPTRKPDPTQNRTANPGPERARRAENCTRNR
ncbi:hypothetical protein JCM3263A_02850 [Thermobifida fusca]